MRAFVWRLHYLGLAALSSGCSAFSFRSALSHGQTGIAIALLCLAAVAITLTIVRDTRTALTACRRGDKVIFHFVFSSVTWALSEIERIEDVPREAILLPHWISLGLIDKQIAFQHSRGGKAIRVLAERVDGVPTQWLKDRPREGASRMSFPRRRLLDALYVISWMALGACVLWILAANGDALRHP